MRKLVCNFRFVVMTALLVSVSACTETVGPGGDGGPSGTAYDIPPFNVVQYGTDFEGIGGPVVVGRDGVVLAMTLYFGNWVIPTEDQTDLYDAWAWGLDSLFVVGDVGTDGKAVIYRFAGDVRTRMTPPVSGWLTAVHGSSGNRVYAVASYGGIIRYNGREWGLAYQGGAGGFADVWVSAGGDVWAVGAGNAVVHYDGSTWHDLSGAGSGFCRAVWGVSPDTVYVAVDNEVWRYHQPVAGESAGERLFTSSLHYVFWDIHATGHEWIVAVGVFGTTVRFDGATWTEESIGTERLTAVTTANSLLGKEAAAVGYGGSAYMYDGSWALWSISTREDWADIGGVSGIPDTLYGIRGGGLARFEGSPPRWNNISSIPSVELRKLFCTGENRIWAIGASTDPYAIDRFAYAFNGAFWFSYWLSSMSDPRDIWCQDLNRVCIVGDDGSVWYRSYGGGVWYFSPTQAVTPPQHLCGVWGHTYDDLYAVGDNGTIVHGTDEGSQWSSMTSNTSAHLRDVWGWAADGVVAVGDGGTVMRYDGSAWQAMTPGVSADLHYVWCRGPEDIWAADRETLVIHWNGAAWERYDTGLPVAPIRCVWGSDTDVWLACENDYVLKHQPHP